MNIFEDFVTLGDIVNLHNDEGFWKNWLAVNYPLNELDNNISFKLNALRFYFVQKICDLYPHSKYRIKRENDKCCVLPLWSTHFECADNDLLDKLEECGIKTLPIDYDVIESTNNIYKNFGLPIMPKKGDIIRVIDFLGDRCDMSLFFDGNNIVSGHCIDEFTGVPNLGKDFAWPNLSIHYWPEYKECYLNKKELENFKKNKTFGILPFKHSWKNTSEIHAVNYSWTESTGKKLYCVLSPNYDRPLKTELFDKCIDSIWCGCEHECPGDKDLYCSSTSINIVSQQFDTDIINFNDFYLEELDDKDLYVI